MSRPRKPYGDPVAIRRTGETYKVRYYPTGVITRPVDRKELPGVFPTEAAAEAAADLLRVKLIEHRNHYLPDGDRGCVSLETAVAAFIAAMQGANQSNDLPLGTLRRIQSDMRLYVAPGSRH